jgi:hypothetical protein
VRRRTLLALPSAFLAIAALPGCIVPSRRAFETPQDAVLSFQSAFARDDEFGEYDCFARGMKQREGLTQQAWSVARGAIFEPLGSIGRFVLRRNSLEDNLLGGTREEGRARLAYALLGRGLEVDLVAETVLRLPDLRDGSVASFPIDGLGDGEAGGGAATWVARIDAPAELASLYLAQGAAWAERLRHWKVDGVRATREEPEGVAALPPPAESRDALVRVEAIRPTRVGRSLGVVRLQFELPLEGGRADRVRWETAAAP